MKLTEDQKSHVLQISREAQHFLNSLLYKEFEKWVESERQMTIASLVTNVREEHEKSLSRSEFVERRSAYYLALATIVGVFKQYAARESELKSIEQSATR